MRTKLILQILVGLSSYIAWAIMVFLDPTLRPDFLHFNIGMAMGTIGLVLRDMQPSAPPAPPADKQSGHALPVMLAIIAGAALLTGCAGMQQAMTGYESAALRGIQAAEDNNIRMWAANACGTPFSAAIRNPQVVPALKALCLPAGEASNPATLLDQVPPAAPTTAAAK